MKVAFVVTRYGPEINGGAELHCKKIVHKMKSFWDVEVLTTCAKDYQSWDNHYKQENTFIDGIMVRRFMTDYSRPMHTFKNCYDLLVNLHSLKYHDQDIALEGKAHVDLLVDKKLNSDSRSSNFAQIAPEEELISQLENYWMRTQGPCSSQLLAYLEEFKDSYDLFIFFTFTYALTYYGLPIVSDKAILVPTIHREACLGFNLFQDLSAQVKYYMFNTEEEKILAHSLFPSINSENSEVVGLGFDKHDLESDDHELDTSITAQPYILYVGRIEKSKGIDELVSFFHSFMNTYAKPLKLILVGEEFTEIPKSEHIISTGFISEASKNHLLQKAEIFIMPSPYESLSIALLEAWNHKIPALVNGACDVLQGHCNRSSGGLYYVDEKSFHQLLLMLLSNDLLRQGLGINGFQYVQKNFTWNTILEKIHRIANLVANTEDSRNKVAMAKKQEISKVDLIDR